MRRRGCAQASADRIAGAASQATTRADFDLTVIDEAHRISAHYFGSELKKTKRCQAVNGELLTHWTIRRPPPSDVDL
jgi:hypothetical protein